MTKLNERLQKKLDSLKFRENVSPESQAVMKTMRAKFYTLCEEVLSLGESRETSEAFTCLETGLQFTIKHLCMVDPGAVVAPIEGREECCGNVCTESNGQDCDPQIAA